MLDEKIKDLKKKINYASQIINCEMPNNLDNQQLVDQFDWFLTEAYKIWEDFKVKEIIKITKED